MNNYKQIGISAFEKVFVKAFEKDNTETSLDYNDIVKVLKDTVHIYGKTISGTGSIDEIGKSLKPPFIQRGLCPKVFVYIENGSHRSVDWFDVINAIDGPFSELHVTYVNNVIDEIAEDNKEEVPYTFKIYYLYEGMIHGEDILVGQYVKWLKSKSKYLKEHFDTPEELAAYNKNFAEDYKQDEIDWVNRYLNKLDKFWWSQEMRINDHNEGLENLYFDNDKIITCVHEEYDPEKGIPFDNEYTFYWKDVKRLRIIDYKCIYPNQSVI